MTDVVQISGSLRNRLALTLIGSAAVLTMILLVVVRSYAAQIAQQGQDSIIGASVTSILDAAVIRDSVVEVDFPYASLSMLSTPSDDRVFYAIYQDGQVLSGYQDLPRVENTANEGSVYRTVEFKGMPIRLASASRTLIGAKARTLVSVSVGQTQDALSGTLKSISKNVAYFGAGFFVLTTLISFWVASTTVGQLRALTTSITRRGPQDLRPVVKPVLSEMAPLVSSLNSLMGRLDHSLQQSETFIVEAAHRIRTPLATVRAYAETTLQRVEKPENCMALRAMIRAIDESSRAAGQLLDHAMIALRADNQTHQNIDLRSLVQELLLRLTPIAEMKDMELRLRGADSVSFVGDPILLQNAIRNLIDNALKYSPAESRVEVTITALPHVQIKICDQGPGFPPGELDGLVTRFTRGSNVAGIVGSGLGLTIAKDVATAHGGTIELKNKPEGGACVTLSF